MTARFYPLGQPGQPWNDDDKAQWRDRQVPRRSYADVVARVRALGAAGRFDVVEYGRIGAHPLLSLRTRRWHAQRPVVVVTGGVHGYETSGVHGALAFCEGPAAAYDDRVNLIVAPCVSPWAYERIQRWNALALDPNRSFRDGGAAAESLALMALVAPWRDVALMHIDLHETTDSDESEFRPALAARDGKAYEPGTIPDGFYLVDDADKPQPAFQAAIIAAVERVTHIAPADARGALIGVPVVDKGVIRYDVKRLGLCAGLTNARFTTTTEVYPDSPRATPAICDAAQVAAVTAGLDFVLAQR
ncbi:MAG: M14 family metallocarboxypeptidase [Deltaproteobacteria bacterium]|nr:M14 family metallocarboxypeptidase [Deltaproteobacteria bacterium]